MDITSCVNQTFFLPQALRDYINYTYFYILLTIITIYRQCSPALYTLCTFSHSSRENPLCTYLPSLHCNGSFAVPFAGLGLFPAAQWTPGHWSPAMWCSVSREPWLPHTHRHTQTGNVINNFAGCLHAGSWGLIYLSPPSFSFESVEKKQVHILISRIPLLTAWLV